MAMQGYGSQGWGAPQGQGQAQGYAPPAWAPQQVQVAIREYEFSEADNATIGGCARWGKVLAIVFIVVGALSLLRRDVLSAGMYVTTAVYLLDCAKALRAVATTRGNDIANMMTALGKLRTALAVRVWFTAVTMGLLVIAASLLVLFFAARG
jgi:hypothetical protein